jgi:hypothetical protein
LEPAADIFLRHPGSGNWGLFQLAAHGSRPRQAVRKPHWHSTASGRVDARLTRERVIAAIDACLAPVRQDRLRLSINARQLLDTIHGQLGP